MSDEVQPEPEKPNPDETPKTKKRKAKAAPKAKKSAKKVLDPLGDPSDGEGRFATGDAEAHAETGIDAQATTAPVPSAERETQPAAPAVPEPAAAAGPTPEIQSEETEPRPTPRLERLQKILAQAGVASRRHAEELITQGRVQVNGQVVTVLGSKADPERDHIRVDGKLLRGAERLRYFVLNKPRGYVTTVNDPEGRPTVMQFFSKLGERLYPVGRLDFQSEGLLLVTNDGELANQLTRAASGVEKTYLVKVSGKPSEDRLHALREGISIERGRLGEGKVRTAPARIRQIRPGDNPWFEVVLIEGRNRELRKMFEEIGHHVEKIRRVGYGPLVLDVPPGKLRELEHNEVEALRKTAEGTFKPRRLNAAAMLPKEAGIPAEQRISFKAGGKGAFRKEGLARRGPSPQRQGFGGKREGGFSRRDRPSYGPGRDRAKGGAARFGREGRQEQQGGSRRGWDRGPSKSMGERKPFFREGSERPEKDRSDLEQRGRHGGPSRPRNNARPGFQRWTPREEGRSGSGRFSGAGSRGGKGRAGGGGRFGSQRENRPDKKRPGRKRP